MTTKITVSTAGWNFDNSYAQLPDIFYSRIDLNPVRLPKLAVLNEALAGELGLNAETMRSEENVAVFAGNRVPEGTFPLAQAYAGHQFGHFTMLGDGRALLVGEQIAPSGGRWDIQLKGSGRTPYSRGGDGRAALGPMLREYIISEAMHALGIPTTRCLAVVTTGEPVYRETELPGAIMTRIAASHLRVGTFQYAANFGNGEELRALADYAIKRHYPEASETENPYLALLQAVIGRQASLIAGWQLIGFIHGVMNTDNMAISGETIDYGPCAFMDVYDPATVFSSIDTGGRYAYGNQPYIGLWNLTRFAESLLPLLHENEDEAVKLAEGALSGYTDLFQSRWLAGMRAKLGLFGKEAQEAQEAQDDALIKDLLGLMHEHRADYTNTFLALTFDRQNDSALFGAPEFAQWRERWRERLGRQPESKEASHELMRRSNPALIPRNHRVEEALEAAVEREDYSVMERFLGALANPFAHAPEQAEYAAPPAPAACPYRTFCGT
ncbi:YdiU family protein [Paenibacillus macerans]|uniref:protein adenylyltransferase SelO n=1 Tax=Paenibacillus macerans TaxID=44252 RepID=UPI00203E79DE|nr:YdiU family protein [Paenibacillus macerans]MCM3703390.1 YdiU family protein [Paenibacillus macerans]